MWGGKVREEMELPNEEYQMRSTMTQWVVFFFFFRLAQTVCDQHTVHSFDLVSPNKFVTACDMVSFCLSLHNHSQ